MGTSNCQRGPPTEGKLEEVAATVAVAAGHYTARRTGRTQSLSLTSSRLPSASINDSGLFGAALTHLATPQTQTMFPVKVKVEKSGEDPEVRGL